MEWTKVHGVLSPSAVDRNGVLTIRQVTAADAGRYKCSAISGSVRSESFAVISVTGERSLCLSCVARCVIIVQVCHKACVS